LGSADLGSADLGSADLGSAQVMGWAGWSPALGGAEPRPQSEVLVLGGAEPRPPHPHPIPQVVAELLRRYVRPREGCAGCETARSSKRARTLYATHSADNARRSGDTRGAEQACHLREHALPLAHVHELVACALPNLKKRTIGSLVETAMRTEFGAEFMGEASTGFRVTLHGNLGSVRIHKVFQGFEIAPFEGTWAAPTWADGAPPRPNAKPRLTWAGAGAGLRPPQTPNPD